MGIFIMIVVDEILIVVVVRFKWVDLIWLDWFRYLLFIFLKLLDRWGCIDGIVEVFIKGY